MLVITTTVFARLLVLRKKRQRSGGRDTDLKISQPYLDIKYAEMPHEIAVEFLFRSTRDQKSNAKNVAFIPTITRL